MKSFRKLVTPLLSVTLLVLPFLVAGDTHETLAKKSPSGKPFYVKSNRLTLPTAKIPELYDQVYPVIFEFNTPNWTKPINLIGYTCTGDDYDNDGWSCPVLWYWLTGVRDRIQEEIFIDNMKVVDVSKFPTDFNCNEIREVFDGLYLDQTARSEFYTFLSTNCQSTQTTILEKSDKYIANGIDSPYRTMREKFFSEYYSLQTPLNRSNDAMYTNARYNYYSSGLFDYYIESRRWSDALSSCKARKIPSTLINWQDLKQVLINVSLNASVNGLELAMDPSKISRYFKQEGIVDCSFTQDSLIVVLQVPVRLIGKSDLKSVEIVPVPYFGENGQVCFVDSGDRKYVIEPLTDTLVPKEDLLTCITSGLCHLQSSTEIGLTRKSCAEILYLEEDDGGICQEICVNPSKLNLPLVTRVASDRVLVFGSGNDEMKNQIKIVCPDFQKMEPVDTSKGAVEVTLPCGCEIHKRGRSIFMAHGECGSEVHVVKIK